MKDFPKRLLVKLSGERFAGNGDTRDGVLNVDAIGMLADELLEVQREGVQLGVVLGGGNILRGHEIAASGIEAAQGHYMGMMGTVINALALQNVLEQKGADTRVLSALEVSNVAEPYIRRRALRHLEKNRIVIFAAGTGNPYFSTDSAGALRAVEIGADMLIKATKVDGIYTADPKTNADAKHLAEVSYKDVLVDDLKVMDGAAIALCRDNNLPLMVCAVEQPGSLLAALKGDVKRTLVTA